MKKAVFAIGSLAAILIACAAPKAETNIIGNENVCASPAVALNKIGKGKDVVLIPGLGSPPSVYDDIVNRYKDKYRFHLVHVAGYAGLPSSQSSGSVFDCAADGIVKYLNNNRINGATLIGHSMGGELAMSINARNEGLVSKIMVVDALPFFSLLFGTSMTPESMRESAEAFTKMTMSQTDEQFKAAQVLAISRLVKSDARRAEILGWSMASSRYAIAKGAEDLMVKDLRPSLANNKAKITMIYGYDAVMGLPPAYVDSLYQHAYKDIPNSSLKRIDNSLHFIMYDQPQVFADEVGKFLAQ